MTKPTALELVCSDVRLHDRSWGVDLERVQDVDWDVGLNGALHRKGMKNLWGGEQKGKGGGRESVEGTNTPTPTPTHTHGQPHGKF